MGKNRLDIEYEYDFFLVAVSCHEKPYRLCWGINQALDLNLEQKEPVMISLKKNAEAVPFTLFMQEDIENEISYSLLSNKSGTNVLIPEQAQADYFFIVHGPFSDEDHARMIKAIRDIPFVVMSYEVDPSLLKSKENLVF